MCIRDRGMAFDPKDLRVLRIDRVNPAAVAVRDQVLQRLAADGGEGLRCADDVDRARIKKPFQILAHPPAFLCNPLASGRTQKSRYGVDTTTAAICVASMLAVWFLRVTGIFRHGSRCYDRAFNPHPT